MRFTTSVETNKGIADRESRDSFFEVNYTNTNRFVVIMVIDDRILSNYLFKLAGFEIDFPLAKEL